MSRACPLFPATITNAHAQQAGLHSIPPLLKAHAQQAGGGLKGSRESRGKQKQLELSGDVSGVFLPTREL